MPSPSVSRQPASARSSRAFFGSIGVSLHVGVVLPGARLEGPRGLLSQAEQHPVDELFLVDGTGEGLPDLPVCEHGVLQVEAEVGVGKGKVAVLAEVVPEVLVLRLPGVLQRREPHLVDAACAKLEEHGGHVGDDAHDASVEKGPSLEIVGVVDEDDFLARLPLLEAIGARPDGVAGQRAFRYVRSFQEVLRHHGGAPAHERRRKGLVVGHAEGVGVEGLGLLDLEEIPGVGRGRLRVDGEPVGEEDVFGREGLPVVPADPLSEVKGDDEAVFRDVPGFGQIADDIEIPVVLHEAVEDEPRDAVRGVVRGKHGDEVACIADGALHQDVPVGLPHPAPGGRRRPPRPGRARHRQRVSAITSPKASHRTKPAGLFMEEDSIAKKRLFQRNWRIRDDLQVGFSIFSGWLSNVSGRQP